MIEIIMIEILHSDRPSRMQIDVSSTSTQPPPTRARHEAGPSSTSSIRHEYDNQEKQIKFWISADSQIQALYGTAAQSLL